MEDDDFTISSYQNHLASRKLTASRCESCKLLFLPPRPVCPQCHGRDMGWQELSGKGKVLGFTSITIVPTTMAARGYGRDNPYVTAVVQTDEGPGITAILEGVDAADPTATSIGMPVIADFKEETQGEETNVTLVFRPA